MLSGEQRPHPVTLPSITVTEHTTEEHADRDRVKLALGQTDNPVEPKDQPDNIPDSSEQISQVSHSQTPEPTHRDNPPGSQVVPPLNLRNINIDQTGKDSLTTPRSGRVRKKSSHKRKNITKVIPPLTFRSLQSLQSLHSDTEEDVGDSARSSDTQQNQTNNDTNVEKSDNHHISNLDNIKDPQEGSHINRYESNGDIKTMNTHNDGHRIPIVSVSHHKELTPPNKEATEDIDKSDQLNDNVENKSVNEDKVDNRKETVPENKEANDTRGLVAGEEKSPEIENEPTTNNLRIMQNKTEASEKVKPSTAQKQLKKTKSLYKSPRAAALIIATLSGNETSIQKKEMASLLTKPRVEEDDLIDFPAKGLGLKRSKTTIVHKTAKTASLRKTSSLKSVTAEPIVTKSTAPPQSLKSSSTTLTKPSKKAVPLKKTSSLKSINSEKGTRRSGPPPPQLRRSSTTLAKPTIALPPIQKSQELVQDTQEPTYEESTTKLEPPQTVVKTATSLGATQNVKEMRPQSNLKRSTTSLQPNTKLVVTKNADPIRNTVLQTKKDEKKEQKRKTSNPKATYSINSNLLRGKTTVATRGGQHVSTSLTLCATKETLLKYSMVTHLTATTRWTHTLHGKACVTFTLD